MQIFRLLLFLSITFVFMYCAQPPDYPKEPVIAFERLGKQQLIQGYGTEDSTKVTISFTDGDGDIGQPDDGDSLDLFVIDTRSGILGDPYKIPFVPEQGAGNGISGEISFVLFTNCCLFPEDTGYPPCYNPAEYPTDTVIYEIYIRDRAGHESNHILSDPVVLLCL